MMSYQSLVLSEAMVYWVPRENKKAESETELSVFFSRCRQFYIVQGSKSESHHLT